MDENSNVHIDYQGMVDQLTDWILKGFLSSITPDKKARDMMIGFINIHRKYGIDAATSMKIMADIAELYKEVDGIDSGDNGTTN